MNLENEPMPWCDHCQCYHHGSARCISIRKKSIMRDLIIDLAICLIQTGCITLVIALILLWVR
jgi:hypothetical protein